MVEALRTRVRACAVARRWPFRTLSPTATSMATTVPWVGEATPPEPSGPVSSGPAFCSGVANASFTRNPTDEFDSRSPLRDRPPMTIRVAGTRLGRGFDTAGRMCPPHRCPAAEANEGCKPKPQKIPPTAKGFRTQSRGGSKT
jgi:hypothetical protein